MTPAQLDRVEGFKVSLAQRGLDVRVGADGSPFKVLFEKVSPESLSYNPDSRVDSGAALHALRTDVLGGPISAGTVLHGAGTARYRVTDVDDNPANIVVVFKVSPYVSA